MKRNLTYFIVSFLLLIPGCSSSVQMSTGQLTSITLNTIGASTSSSLTVSASGGAAYSSVTVDMGSGFLTANICNGKTIFGLSGSGSCSTSGVTKIVSSVYGTLASTAHREAGTQQIAQAQESGFSLLYQGTSLPSNYREVPNPTRDDDGVTSVAMAVDHANFADCGEPTSMTGSSLSPTLIANRISHCATVNVNGAQWNGTIYGNAGQTMWYLVTRLTSSSISYEVWQDQRTGLLWSSLLTTPITVNGGNGNRGSGATWCQAAGNTESATLCSGTTASYCAEVLTPALSADGTTWSTTSYSPEKGGIGLNTSPTVSWRLPTRYDYEQADIDGIRFVMPDMGTALGTNQAFPSSAKEWTSTVLAGPSPTPRSMAWYFSSLSGSTTPMLSYDNTSKVYGVRCVGH